MALIASRSERPLAVDELLACAVDRTGVIRAADAAWVGRNGFGPGDPLDQLRHPDMPRTILTACLTALVAGHPAAAYVKAVTRDGAFYWAFALATGVGDSVLIVAGKPLAPAFDEALKTYAAIRAQELAVGPGGAVPASARPLPVAAPDLRAGLLAEAAAPGRARRSEGPLAPAARDLAAVLARVRARLARHDGLAEALGRKAGFVEELAEDIRLFALNAILAAHRLADGDAIGAVAGLLQTRSDEAGPEILTLRAEIARTVEVLGEANFRVAVAKLHVELLAASTAEPEPWLLVLVEAVEASVGAAADALGALDSQFERLADVSQSVAEHLKTIQFLELQGRIEAARADDTRHVRTLFEEIGQQVRAAGRELREVSKLRAVGGASDLRRRTEALSRTARRG